MLVELSPRALILQATGAHRDSQLQQVTSLMEELEHKVSKLRSEVSSSESLAAEGTVPAQLLWQLRLMLQQKLIITALLVAIDLLLLCRRLQESQLYKVLREKMQRNKQSESDLEREERVSEGATSGHWHSGWHASTTSELKG